MSHAAASSASRLVACPICHSPLTSADRELFCAQNHHFDRAREGFVNLLRPGKHRKAVIGDDADMIASRRRFLDRGHYSVLSEGLTALFADLVRAEPVTTMVDVGCGEGSFTRAMVEGVQSVDAPLPETLAFDISRPAVKFTARRVPQALSAVASAIEMPVLDHAADVVASVMSPLHDAEFARVVAPGARIVVVSPGDSHLAELREVLYDEYRPHDELVRLGETFTPIEQRRFTTTASLTTRDELDEVWGMTPYRWNTPREGQQRFTALDALDVTVHFVATVYRAPDAS